RQIQARALGDAEEEAREKNLMAARARKAAHEQRRLDERRQDVQAEEKRRQRQRDERIREVAVQERRLTWIAQPIAEGVDSPVLLLLQQVIELIQQQQNVQDDAAGAGADFGPRGAEYKLGNGAAFGAANLWC
ncbi:unnamed protein product, partial [Symbiodinium sp. KB8]